MADTRRDKRAPVSLKVRFKSATVDEFIEHYSKDVSRGGIYIKSSQPMPVGTLLKFQFQLKDESALIRGVGRVVWTRAEEDAEADQPAGMGIKFIKMDNDSRATVERIIEAQGPDEGMYERGREGATEVAPPSSAPPPPESGSFFPELPPAELPPPEDRTAVREVTQLLAAALTEGGTDESATREAQERAAEARRRTEELAEERRQEAEQRRQEAERQSGLPSMIIDPSLGPRAGRTTEDEAPVKLTPLPQVPEPRRGLALHGADDDENEPDTEPPPPAATPIAVPSTTSIPQVDAEPARRSWLPYVIIGLLVIVAAVVALRGGPRELPIDTGEPVSAPAQEPAAQGVEPAATPEPPAAEPVAAPDATRAAVPEIAAATVSVEIVTAPSGAEVLVGDEPRGAAPLTLKLAEGVPVVLRARAKGYAEASEALTPRSKHERRKLTLTPLPYVVHIESTPAGASVTVGGRRGTTPVDLTLASPPTAVLPVSARLSGYDTARARLSPSAFTEEGGTMRAVLSLTLKASVAPAAAKPAAAKKPDQAEPAPAAEPPKEEDEPAPTAEPPRIEQAPAPEPPAEPKPEAPKEELPDNPFGE